MAKNQTEKNRAGLKLNVGMVIFLIIFLYIVFSVYSYTTREQIGFYEVELGTIVRQNSYEGIVLREEEAVSAESSGYIHFYVQEGRRVAAKANIYTIDETGDMERYLANHPELTEDLGQEEIDQIRYRLSSFSKEFSDGNFYALYSLKSDLDSSVLGFSNVGSAENLEAALSQMGISYQRVRSPKAGVISYTVDGYESLSEGEAEASLFDTSSYQAKTTRPGALVEGDRAVYKLVTSPNWEIIFPMTEEERARYQERESLTIKFLETDEVVTASFRFITGKDSKIYGKLSLNTLMERYINQRYIDFEIVNTNRNGLKIPITAVTEKEFYVIPRDFLRSQENYLGFLRQTVIDGQISHEFIETEIYRLDEQYCYLTIPAEQNLATGIKTGDILVKESGSQNFVVGPTRSLQGVYNINRGYCIFRQIIPVEQNEAYMIVEQNTDYGVSVYDHIVLNADMVQEGQIVYQ